MTDNELQLPDLEIYVKGDDIGAMIQWLESTLGKADIQQSNKQGAKLVCHNQQQPIPIVIVKNAGKTGFTSIWFDSRTLPWKDDVECGRAAFAALQKTVRCIDSVWQSGDDPDRWLEVSSTGETIINWQ